MGKKENNVLRCNNKAIGIVRVSSNRQKDKITFQTQRDAINLYAIEKGLNVVKIVEIVESAKDPDNRKKYDDAISWVIDNDVYNVLFYCQDREARNFTNAETNEKLARAGIIAVHSVKDCNVFDLNSPIAESMKRDILTLQAKYTALNIGDRTAAALKTKAQMGWFPASKIPLGYMFGLSPTTGSKYKTIVPDTNKEKVGLVQREFELRAQGLSVESIRAKNLEEGFVPAEMISSYHCSTIDRRLKNTFYRGYYIWEGEKYIGNHELIISQGILDKIDAVYRGKRSLGNRTSNGAFAHGWFKCGMEGCGCNIVFDEKRKRSKKTGNITRTYKFYHCTDGRGEHKKQCLRQVNITEEKIMDQFSSIVDSIELDDVLAQQIANALNETKEKMKVSIAREMDGYNYVLKKLEDKENTIFDDFNVKNIDKEMYDRQLVRVREERAHYTDLLKKANIKITDVGMDTAQYIIELARRAKALWAERSPIERREFLNKLLSNPRLNGANVEYELKKPFLIISKMKEKPDWRPQRE